MNQHVITFCEHHFMQNVRLFNVYKAIQQWPADERDTFSKMEEQLMVNDGRRKASLEEQIEYFCWLAVMAKIALDAEEKGVDTGVSGSHLDAILDPYNFQVRIKNELGIKP